MSSFMMLFQMTISVLLGLATWSHVQIIYLSTDALLGNRCYIFIVWNRLIMFDQILTLI
jgi:hypothetical protein